MDSFGNIRPLSEHQNVYTASGTSVNNTTDVWLNPNEAKMVFMLTIGAGAGGYSGGNNTGSGQAIDSSVGGGGGGNSMLLVPCCLLPPSLAITVGYGGSGGAPTTGDSVGGTPGLGLATAISSWPTVGKNTYSPVCTFAYGNKGQIGASSTTPAQGGGAVAISSCYLSAFGIFQSKAGGNGSPSGTDQPSNATYGATVTCGGASGGGVSSTDAYAGANVVTTTGDPILIFGYGINVVVGGGATSGGDNLGNSSTFYAGLNGIQAQNMPGLFPLRFAGGSGGAGAYGSGASTSSGGNGGIGGGGGAGGANSSVSATSSGAGGAGGPGLAMITWW